MQSILFLKTKQTKSPGNIVYGKQQKSKPDYLQMSYVPRYRKLKNIQLLTLEIFKF